MFQLVEDFKFLKLHRLIVGMGIAISFFTCMGHTWIGKLLNLDPNVVLYFSGLIGIACTSYSFIFQHKFHHSSKVKDQWMDPVLVLATKGIDLHELVAELDSTSNHIGYRIDTILSEVTRLDDLIHRISVDMDRIFDSAIQLSEIGINLNKEVGNSSREVRFMYEIVDSVILEIDSKNENMQNLIKISLTGVEKIKHTNSLIKQISEKADDMLKMVTFINSITKETNLLAINAAIEASHSDKEGKGFAIIADEMKKLAILTSQKAKEITTMMKGNIDNYKEAHRLSEESGEAFHFITSEIHVISGTIAEVVQTVQEIKNRGNTIINTSDSLGSTVEHAGLTFSKVHSEILEVNNALYSIKDLSESVKKEMAEIENLQKIHLSKSGSINKYISETHKRTDQFLGLP